MVLTLFKMLLSHKFNAAGKKFPGKGFGAQRTLWPIDTFWLFITRGTLDVLKRDLALEFNISIFTVSDFEYKWSNCLFVMLGSLTI